MVMDPSMYYTGGVGMNFQGPSQTITDGHDTSMTGMLGDSLLDDFDSMPVAMETTMFNDGQRAYAPGDPILRGMDGELSQNRDIPGPQEESVDAPMSGAGAGPLPTGFGAQSTQDSRSGVTEFTKRRNWPQRIIEELRDLLHILTPDGRIVYMSTSGEALTGYLREELVGNFIVDYIHPDDSGIFVREFNESIASGHPLRFFYRFRRKDDTYTIFESHGHPHLGSEAAVFGSASAAGYCKGFFMMARPYPTKNAALLDSFLEHKVENARLRKRIESLKREEAEDEDESHRKWLKKQEGQSEGMSEETDTVGSTSTVQASCSNPNMMAMAPPAKPSSMNGGLTRAALEESNAGLRPDSITDKMARYEGVTHIETIEMLTGLRYQEGERSRGISTGAESPALIRGDAGIEIPVDKERGVDKKKKLKLPDEYVCTDCGTLDSPEWRKGPKGPKTLCNACGLRWAKREKKGKDVPLVPMPRMIMGDEMMRG